MALMYFSQFRLRFGHKLAPADATRTGSLKAGDWVEVRPLHEVMATLDARGCLEAMPFMPEMARLCGQRVQVYKRADRTCDTIETFTGRRLEAAVHLTGLRCNGGFHGGCQAGCLMFWKEAWLKPVDGPGACAPSEVDAGDHALESLVQQARREDGPGGEVRYRCQATELLRATTPLSVFDPRNYLRDIAAGNVTWGTLLRTAALSVYVVLRRLSGAKPLLAGTAKVPPPPPEPLNLQPGELVQVRSRAEILATLDERGSYRGLSFDAEMEPYCGQTLRVLRRVDRILDEKTGRMLRLRKDCIILDGVVCSGKHCGMRRVGCPRAVYPYWREAWLRRVESATPMAVVAAPDVGAGATKRELEPLT